MLPTFDLYNIFPFDRKIPVLNFIAKMCCRCHLSRRRQIMRFSSHNQSHNQSGDNTQTTAEGSVSIGRRTSAQQHMPDITKTTARKRPLYYKSQRSSHHNINTLVVDKRINSTGQGSLGNATLPLARRHMSDQDLKLLRTVAVRCANGKCETML